MSRFSFSATPLSGVQLVQRRKAQDTRGYFSRFYCADEFATAGFHKPIVQINHTFTHAKGAVRGLHFQRPNHAESKLVSCLRGEVWDVAIDVRAGSPTFLCWHAQVLSAANHQSLLIPEGCAHGFQTLSADCELIYLHTATYHPQSEGALNFADPRLGIAWPLPFAEVSDRDQNHPMIDASFQGISL